MNRPWKIWLSFALCSAVLLGAMGWVSRTVLRLDRAQAQAQAQADLEEKVRLALWRMDSMLAPLIAQETARPYFAYTAFHPAERAYGRMYNPLNAGEVLVPSPLLTQVSTNILLHFQLDPDGRLTSPQVPDGNQRDLAEAQFTTHEQVEAAAGRLHDLETILNQEASSELAQSVKQTFPSAPVISKTSSLRNRDALLAIAPARAAADTGLLSQNRAQVQRPEMAQTQARLPSLAQQFARNDQELEARAQSVQQAVGLNLNNAMANLSAPIRASQFEEVLKPVWLGDTLVLVRRVIVEGQNYIQGCRLDWPATRQWLLEGVRDLLPGARLEPLKQNGTDAQGHMLASLPVRVLPGLVSPNSGSVPSPMIFALALAWACILVAGLAVAVLLQGALSLSERRAAFVAAVTHELRTPLTTFKMYSEMLAEGMVRDEIKRREYLGGLCTEADRLQHLVENVLAYARLERGKAPSRLERIVLRQLLVRVKPRLLQRAEQSGMGLQQEADPAALQRPVDVDVSSVEQILFNLVDNACKYGARGPDKKMIQLEVLGENSKFVVLRVRDHGQGISAETARRLFQPFSKTANEAATTAPGVGLGLALCRRLSRSFGGDLRFNPALTPGACFDLLLPVANDEPACTTDL